MKELIESREKYDTLMDTGVLKIDLEPNTRRKKGCGPIAIDDPLSNFKYGCGVQAGDVRRVKWRDDSKGSKVRFRGGIVVAALSVAYCENTSMWEVTFIRRVETAPVYLLARGAGYTQNPELSIDPEAAAMYEPGLDRIARDTQTRIPRPEPEPPTAEEIEAEERAVAEKADKIDAISDALAA